MEGEGGSHRDHTKAWMISVQRGMMLKAVSMYL